MVEATFIPRTQDQIVKRIESIKESRRSLFGFPIDVLIPYLDYEHAKPYLKDTATKESWESDGVPYETDRESVLVRALDYLEFAWEKALDHRGLSASRSIEKMESYMWLLGESDLVEVCETGANYAPYGAPILAKISDRLGYKMPEGADVARMTQGLSCRPGCEEGCRS